MERFQFDPRKSRLNKEHHGVDFECAQELWDEDHLVIPAKNVAGESRYLILARMEDKCYAAVFTKRGEAIRIISCHRADGRLERLYESHIRGKADA